MKAQAFVVNIVNAVGRNRSVISVVASAVFASTSFLYIYTLASYLKIVVSVLHHFYNYIGFFDMYIFTRDLDHLIIALGVSIWLALSIRKGKARFVISGTYGGLAILAVLFRLDVILDIVALLSVPLIILLLTCNRFVPKMKILSKD